MKQYTYKININGVVQGVGFRPFIYTLASKFDFKGSVSNGSSGVEIYINATYDQLKQFLSEINNNKPSLSQIDNITYNKIDNQLFDDFSIKKAMIVEKKRLKFRLIYMFAKSVRLNFLIQTIEGLTILL